MIHKPKRDIIIENKCIGWMLYLINEYELIKRNEHPKYKTVQAFYDENNLCKRNFLKYYNRFIQSGRDPAVLLPQKRGAKPKNK